jgi:hypothetical protein
MNLIPEPYKLLIEIATVGVAVVGIGFIGARLEHNSMQVKLDAVQHAWDAERAQAQASAIKTQADYRSQESAWNQKLQEAEDAKRKANAIQARVIAADRADNDRMRNELAAYASGGSRTADDTLAACRSRAAILGQAVEDGMRVQGEMAATYGDLATDYGTMFDGWPVQIAP